MDNAPLEFGEGYAASQIARRDNRFRAMVKHFYLERVLRHVTGPTVDIGCGAGQLLERLPKGSIGLEVNPVLVKALQGRGLDVRRIRPDETAIVLDSLKRGSARTAVLSHVLEHFGDAARVLHRLIADCRRLGIRRLIVVVPGANGYESDSTHRTFVTIDYLERNGLLAGKTFNVSHRSFFPGDVEWLGRFFIYHELMIVYDLTETNDTDLAS